MNPRVVDASGRGEVDEVLFRVKANVRDAEFRDLADSPRLDGSRLPGMVMEYIRPGDSTGDAGLPRPSV